MYICIVLICIVLIICGTPFKDCTQINLLISRKSLSLPLCYCWGSRGTNMLRWLIVLIEVSATGSDPGSLVLKSTLSALWRMMWTQGRLGFCLHPLRSCSAVSSSTRYNNITRELIKSTEVQASSQTCPIISYILTRSQVGRVPITSGNTDLKHCFWNHTCIFYVIRREKKITEFWISKGLRFRDNIVQSYFL